MRWFIVFAAIYAAGPSQAQDAGALLRCPSVKPDTDRLACFDAAMKPATAAAAVAETPATPTKEIVAAPASAGAPMVFKVVDAEDVYVTPNKYEGRGIELRKMRCFHADKDEYRCIAPGAVMLALFSKSIRPESERAAIENDCGEIKKMATSPKCEKTVRFVPTKSGEDLVNGYRRRVVVGAPYLEIAAGVARSKR